MIATNQMPSVQLKGLVSLLSLYHSASSDRPTGRSCANWKGRLRESRKTLQLVPEMWDFQKKNFKHFQYESSDQHDNDLSAREDALTPLGGLFKNTDLGKVVL